MLTPITITGLIGLPDGSMASGGMAFQLSLAGVPTGMKDSVTDEIIAPAPIQAAVNDGQLLANPVGGGPYLPLVLLANDDPTTEPTGTVYIVTEQLQAGSLPPWPLTVHFNAAGGTIDIASQRPTP